MPLPPTSQLTAAEDSLPVAALLAASGGFLDAFTYVAHGHVFANAMTGNVVLLGVYAATGNWTQSWRHVPPILAFLLGVAAAQSIRLPQMHRWLPNPAVAALSAEMAFLLAGGWLPDRFPSLPLVLGISFLAALQSSSFRLLEKWPYNSTMTTGNLRSLAELPFEALSPGRRAEALRRARLLGIVCLAFLAGAVLGGICTLRLNNKALWAADVLLFFAWLLVFRSARNLYKTSVH